MTEERAPGHCCVCGEWTASGILLATIERNSGPAVDVVVHPECEPVRRAQARTRLRRVPAGR